MVRGQYLEHAMHIKQRLYCTLPSVQHIVRFMYIGCSWCWPLTTDEPRLFGIGSQGEGGRSLTRPFRDARRFPSPG